VAPGVAAASHHRQLLLVPGSFARPGSPGRGDDLSRVCTCDIRTLVPESGEWDVRRLVRMRDHPSPIAILDLNRAGRSLTDTSGYCSRFHSSDT
jgi:hypothetical protein